MQTIVTNLSERTLVLQVMISIPNGAIGLKDAEGIQFFDVMLGEG